MGKYTDIIKEDNRPMIYKYKEFEMNLDVDKEEIKKELDKAEKQLILIDSKEPKKRLGTMLV